MKGDIICHAVEVGTYQRRLPNGRVITVKAYKRNGNAAQDDMKRRMADKRAVHDFNYIKPAEEHHRQIQQLYKQGAADKSLLDDSFSRLNNARINQEKAVAAERYRQATVADVMKYAATDAYETVQTAVGNLFEEAKFQAQSAAVIVEGTAKNIVDTVRNGWDAVKNFFGGLFGQKKKR